MNLPSKISAFASILTVLWLMTGGIAMAMDPSEQLKDPTLEARAKSLSAQFRCLVCQNQSINDSDATLAKDIRTIVREQILAQKSDEDIRTFLTERYGEYVLLEPKRDAGTLALWAAPFLVFLIGFMLARSLFRVKKKSQ
jgi:cytochrome c-type biogenesis protein CcmH